MAPDIQRKQKFAQPLVFFRLDPHLSALAKSDYLSTVSSFRLRIPGRQVARSLTSSVHALPSLELLDLSTCNVLEADVGLVLTRFTRLKHLILDACAIVRAEMHESDWFEFGKQCATVGVNCARQREKKLKAWLDVYDLLSSSRPRPFAFRELSLGVLCSGYKNASRNLSLTLLDTS